MCGLEVPAAPRREVEPMFDFVPAEGASGSEYRDAGVGEEPERRDGPLLPGQLDEWRSRSQPGEMHLESLRG